MNDRRNRSSETGDAVNKPSKRVSARERWKGPTAALLLVLVAGGVFSWWTIQRTDQEMRRNLLLQARMAAQTLPLEAIVSLSASEADLENPGYHQIREQLKAIQRSDQGLRFVYLLGRGADGGLFFFADNEPIESEAFSPPGQPYAEASEELQGVFRTGHERVLGPGSDRWGVWISSLAPLRDPQTGNLVAVLGMDMDGRSWNRILAHAALPPALQALMAALVVLFLGRLSQRDDLERLAEGQATALQESEEQYRMLTEHAVSGIASHEMLLDDASRPVDYVFLSANPAFERHTGLPVSEVIGRRASEVLPGIEKSPFMAIYGRVVLTGEPVSFEQYSEPLDRHFHINAFRLGGRRFATVFTDITERKRAEEDLRFLGAITANMSDSIVATDTRFRITYLNQKAEELYGYTLQEVQGQTPDLFNADPMAEKIQKELYETIASGRVYVNESVNRKKDGSTFYCEYKVMPLTDRDGAIQAYVGIQRDVTDRKRAEEALQQAKDVVENIQIGLYIYHLEDIEDDRTLRMIYANPASEHMTGIKVRDVKGRTLDENFPDLRQINIPQRYAEVVRTGAMRTFEDIHYGDHRIVQTIYSVKAFPLPNNHVGIAFEDITERKRAEKELIIKEQRLKEAQEIGNTGHWEYDLQDNQLHWSEQMFRVYEQSPDSFKPTYDSVIGLFHPDDREMVSTEFQKCLAHKTNLNVEHRILTPSGNVKHVIQRATIKYADQKPLAAIGTVADITDRKKTEEALRQQSALIKSLFDSVPDIIFVKDVEGVYLGCNPPFAEFVGRPREEIVGWTDYDLFEKDVADFFREQDELMLEQGTSRHNDEWITYPDGRKILIDTLKTPYRGPDGSLIGILGISRDVTDRKRAEEALLKANRELEEATVRANEMAGKAEMASTAKSEFLANMSHEIRTPMNGVIGMTGLLLDTDLTDDQRRYGEIVRASAESLLGIINDILDFSKIEAGKLDLETLDFDLLSLLDDFVGTLAVKAHEKGLELLCSADLDVPVLLRGDPGRLRQILTNLAGNAVKFTSKGEVAIRVSLVKEPGVDRDEDGSVLLRFSVRDTGMGIPEDKIGLLFEQFSQVDASTTRKYGGTGLGLAISKQLALLMGGEIGVDSEAGKGSEFWFTARLGKGRQEIPDQAPDMPHIHQVRVLVVDDNTTNREIFVMRLASWGMRPSEARDGPEALKMLYQALEENDPFRLAVIDMQMPGMDGETLGRIIQADPRLQETLMVMLTSLGFRGDARRYAEIGFAAYLTKPVRHLDLHGVLAQVLARGQGAEPASGRPIATRHTVRETLPRFQGVKARILVAEDNITNQKVALGILRKLGLRADAVADGAEAVKALETLPYDLVLMDVQMPVLDGLEATRRIRAIEAESAKSTDGGLQTEYRGGGIPVIAMTAHAMEGDRERCLEAGMNDYVSKPISPQALTQVLEKWLDKTSGMEEKGQARGDEPDDPPPVVSRTPLVFDRAGMMERLMDDEALARTIMEGFLSDMPQQIQALETLLAAGDVSGAGRLAHTIKGAASNVGGEAFRALALNMEEAAREGDLQTLQALPQSLRKAFDELKRTMEASWLHSG